MGFLDARPRRRRFLAADADEDWMVALAVRDCCFLATGILDANEDGMAELGVAGARAQLCRRVLVAAHQQGDDGGVSVGQIQQLYLALGHRGDQAKASSENMMCDPVDPHIFQYVVGPIKRMKSWEEYMGKPMGQTVPDTCTLVACTVCVEAMHRVAYETYHGRGTFGCTAAAPRKLRRACRRDKIWTPKDGAAIEGVLDKMKEMGGVATTRAAAPAPWLLPLKGWKRYEGGGLTQEQAADLLDHGPCLASVWTCPWWWFCTSSVDNLVYRGRGTNLAGAMYSIYLLGIDVDLLLDTVMGHHAVVCYGYRICAASSSSSGEPDEMHVLVMDNQDESGPSRWVDYRELIDIVTVTVERLQPPLPLRGGCRIEYPPRRRC